MKLDKAILETKKYIMSFDQDSHGIRDKRKHTINVARVCKRVAQELNLTDEDVILSRNIGLLHDIGRFRQLEKFGNHSDQNVDHADLGYQYLFEDNAIEEFDIDQENHEIVSDAVRYHNKLEIPNTVEGRNFFFSQLIRDCDKVVILSQIIDGSIKLRSCDEAINESTLETFFARNLVSNKYSNDHDRNINFLSFIFDIRFLYTFVYLKEINLLDNLFDKMPDNYKYQECYEELSRFIDEKIKEYEEQEEPIFAKTGIVRKK